MSGHIDTTHPKARKEHDCMWCGDKIVIGENHSKWVGIWEGDFQSNRMHHECVGAFNESALDDYGFEPHQQRRGKTVVESEDTLLKEQQIKEGG